MKKCYKRVKAGKNGLLTVKKEGRLTGLIIPGLGTALLKRDIEGKMEVTGRRGRRHKQVLDGLKETGR